MTKNNKYLFVFCFVLSLIILNTTVAYGQYRQNPPRRYNNNKPFDIGFRVGLNAHSPMSYCVYSNDEELFSSIKNRTGYLTSVFFRINLDQVFMQPEFEWSLSRQEMKFALTEPTSGISLENFYQRSQNANVNILVGYSIIKDGPFRFNAFAGPAFKYNYTSKYKYSDSVFYDNSNHFYTYGILGFSLNIARFYADIRYEISINDTDIEFGKISSANENLKNIRINKSENNLNFSFGIVF